ncbi:MAG: DUF1033 family protein [Streptococcaceae bacterium]|jgi:hypothetical protein|nr:DUF1033 family protein [Streptococcaceae bacterium]
MYRVVEMRGDNEPWWFFEDWRKDIVAKFEFDDFYEALKVYKQEWQRLARAYPEFRSQEDFLAAFWTKSDTRWCLECDENLQQYHGLMLLEDWHPVETFEYRPSYAKATGFLPHQFCRFKGLVD